METIEVENRSQNAIPSEKEDLQKEMPKAKTEIIRAEIEESKGDAPQNKQRKKKWTRKKLSKYIVNEDAAVIVGEQRDNSKGAKLVVSNKKNKRLDEAKAHVKRAESEKNRH